MKRRLAHTGRFSMSIAKEFRDQSIGSSLVVTMLSWARECPEIEKVCLDVLSNNSRAIHIYEKLGFKVEGLRIKEVKISPGNYLDALLMYQMAKNDG